MGVIHDTPHTTHPSVLIVHARIDASSIHHPTTPLARRLNFSVARPLGDVDIIDALFASHRASPRAAPPRSRRVT